MNRGGLFWGRVTAEALGEEPERFFNLLSRREIPVYDIREEEAPSAAESGKKWEASRRSFYRGSRRYEADEAHCPESRSAPSDQKKSGIAFFLFRMRRRKLLAAGAAAFFFLLYFLSLFVWDILSKAISVLRRKRSSIIWIRSGFLRNAPVKGLLQFH